MTSGNVAQFLCEIEYTSLVCDDWIVTMEHESYFLGFD